MPNLTVKFTCNLCGLHRQDAQVLERKPEQDVVEWMEYQVIPSVKREHARRSPGCHPKLLDEILIPSTGRPNIGGTVVH